MQAGLACSTIAKQRSFRVVTPELLDKWRKTPMRKPARTSCLRRAPRLPPLSAGKGIAHSLSRVLSCTLYATDTIRTIPTQRRTITSSRPVLHEVGPGPRTPLGAQLIQGCRSLWERLTAITGIRLPNLRKARTPVERRRMGARYGNRAPSLQCQHKPSDTATRALSRGRQ